MISFSGDYFSANQYLTQHPQYEFITRDGVDFSLLVPNTDYRLAKNVLLKFIDSDNYTLGLASQFAKLTNLFTLKSNVREVISYEYFYDQLGREVSTDSLPTNYAILDKIPMLLPNHFKVIISDLDGLEFE